MRKVIFLLFLSFLCFHITSLKAQNYYLSGTVQDQYGFPLSKAGIFIKNTDFFSFTDDSGRYKILLPVGTFTLLAEKKSFEQTSIKVTISSGDVVQDVVLENKNLKQLGTVTLTSNRKDRAKELISSTIKAKANYKTIVSHSKKAFVKASLKQLRQQTDSVTNILFVDTTQSALAQIFLKIDVSDEGSKEERLGVKKQGDMSSLYWLSSTESNIHVYDNRYIFEGVCEVPIISPLSNMGLISYRFSTKEVTLDSQGDFVYTINYRPIKLGNALGNGYLIIKDSSFQVLKLAMELPSMHLPEYNKFGFRQQYFYTQDSACLVQSQAFFYKIKGEDYIQNGQTNVTFDSFQFNKSFGSKYFNNLLSFTSQKAYEKDSVFWSDVSKGNLDSSELIFQFKQDSIEAVENSLWYKDSMQKAFNKPSLKKIFLTGQGIYNHKKERLIFFQPAIFAFQPFMVAGSRIGPWISYSKQYKDKKALDLFPRISYGLRNGDFKGNFSGNYLYDPIKRKSLSWNVSRDFEVINPFDAWINIFRRSNFFESDNIELNHRQELFNGFFIRVGGGFSNRRSIGDYDFDPRGDSLFIAFGDSARNNPVEFSPYKAAYFNARLSYTPGQKYMLEPYQKIILGSKWPTFGINYEKGVPGIFNSAIDFDYLEFDITQKIQLGLLGRMNYRVNTGQFLQRRDLRLVDYVFQPNSNPFLFTNPNYTFQRLDSVYRTFDWFLEAHVLHRFNGAILNKIPLLKKLQMVETAGAGFLISPENNLNYVEAFVGLEKILKIFEERFRVGVYLVGAQTNRFETPLRLKFSIEYFNRQDNSWMF